MAKDYKVTKKRKSKIQLTAAEKVAHDAAVAKAVAHFADTYVSTDGTRLSNLQQLCKDLEVEVGDNTLACKDVSDHANWLEDPI